MTIIAINPGSSMSSPSPRQLNSMAASQGNAYNSPWASRTPSLNSQGLLSVNSGYMNADAVAEYHTRPALHQLHQFFAQTLNRLMTQVTSGHIAEGTNIRERMMTLSSSTLVADIQLLMTAIQSKSLA